MIWHRWNLLHIDQNKHTDRIRIWQIILEMHEKKALMSVQTQLSASYA